MDDLHDLHDLDSHFKELIRAEARYRFGKVLGLKQNENSISRDVLIKDTALSNRVKNILTKYNVATIGDLEDMSGWDMLNAYGLGAKSQRELSMFEYVNKLKHHRD
jgi:DNA-directed RNA polymerase alpha subunit